MLSDLLVVELGDHPGMHYAGKIFADRGAAVMRVVSRAGEAQTPDPAREKSSKRIDLVEHQQDLVAARACERF